MARQNTPTKKKAPAPTTANGAFNNGNEPRNFSSKSTATAAQYVRLLRLLRVGPRNTIELRGHGVMAPAARVKELNDRHGFTITTADRLTIWDAEGFPHAGVALYRLDGEPEMV